VTGFTEAERAFLRHEQLARMATASSTGEPDVAVVGFSLTVDGAFQIQGMDHSRTRKYHNIRGNPRASLVVDDLASVDPWAPRGVKVTGSASIEEDSRGRTVLLVKPETVWSWGLNLDAETHFGPIEKRPF
jgi:pyridoxamine 5'-phosphate oxidase family protein